MTLRTLLAFLALAALADAPARAADAAQLDCTLNALSVEQRAILGTAVAEVRMQHDPILPAFNQALDRCASELGWNGAEREMARRFALSRAGSITLRREFEAAGIDVAAIERLIRTDSELAAAMRSPDFAEQDVQSFARRHGLALQAAAGRQRENLGMLRRIGRFIGAVAIMEAARHRFMAG